MSDGESNTSEFIFGLAFLLILVMLYTYMTLGHFFEHKKVQNYLLVKDQVSPRNSIGNSYWYARWIYN